jgi:hypothetical protein
MYCIRTATKIYMTQWRLSHRASMTTKLLSLRPLTPQSKYKRRITEGTACGMLSSSTPYPLQFVIAQSGQLLPRNAGFAGRNSAYGCHLQLAHIPTVCRSMPRSRRSGLPRRVRPSTRQAPQKLPRAEAAVKAAWTGRTACIYSISLCSQVHVTRRRSSTARCGWCPCMTVLQHVRPGTQPRVDGATGELRRRPRRCGTAAA